MPIEFPCQQCGQTLRVPDEAAGKLSRCPKCSFVSRAPEAPAPPSTPNAESPGTYPPPKDPYPTGQTAAASSATQNPFAGGANPFRDDAVPTPAGETNPYMSPAASREYAGGSGVTSQFTLRMVRNKVHGPAIALIIIGSLNLLWLGLFIVVGAVQVIDEGMAEELIGFAILVPYCLLKSVPVIYGGLQMMKLRNYPWAMAATIISLLPCYCYLFELPFAIWALVVLCDYHVRAVFREGPAAFQDTRSPFRSG